MNTGIKKSLYLIFILFVSMPAYAGDKQGDTLAGDENNLQGMTITLANGEYAPFFSEGLKHYGVVSLIVKAAFAEEGINVNYVFRPWKRGLKEAAKGKWHGSVGWLKNEARLKEFFFSEPIMKPTAVFFQRKNNPVKWETASDLKGLKVALITGFSYGDEINKAEDEDVILVTRSVDAMGSLKMLIRGRVDLAALEREVGINLLNTRFSSDEAVMVEPQKNIIHSKDLFLLLSRKKKESKELIRLFNIGLGKLEASGKTEQYWMESRKGNYITQQ